MTVEPNRRSFFVWALVGLGAIFSAILGVPVLAYIVDPLNRKGKQGNFKLVEGIRLDELQPEKPSQGVIRDTRYDGWTLYPNDVVGRVWVVKTGQGPRDLLVLTTICPHLGCSVNLSSDGKGFLCPCHQAAFALNGAREEKPGQNNPAARSMDTLEWKVDEMDHNRILVQYQNFEPSSKDKKVC